MVISMAAGGVLLFGGGLLLGISQDARALLLERLLGVCGQAKAAT
jgi:hypothetical protein